MTSKVDFICFTHNNRPERRNEFFVRVQVDDPNALLQAAWAGGVSRQAVVEIQTDRGIYSRRDPTARCIDATTPPPTVPRSRYTAGRPRRPSRYSATWR